MQFTSIVGRAARFVVPGALFALGFVTLGACDGPAIEPEPEQARAEEQPLAGPQVVKPQDATGRFEQRFLESQIEHHGLGIATSRLCAERAVHGELRDLCSEMVVLHTRELREMQGWLAEWYGRASSLKVLPSSDKELVELEGAELEQELLEELMRHHLAGAARADTCTLLAERKELLASCSDQMMDRTAEVDLMETWLREWYLGC